MTVDLPLARGTNGQMLANQSLHSIVRDMISRIGAANGTGHSFFPQYGVSGTYSKQANHGFEDTFQASLMMALEWGCFEYARGLLHNWLSYYLIPDMDDDGFSFTGINCEPRFCLRLLRSADSSARDRGLPANRSWPGNADAWAAAHCLCTVLVSHWRSRGLASQPLRQNPRPGGSSASHPCEVFVAAQGTSGIRNARGER